MSRRLVTSKSDGSGIQPPGLEARIAALGGGGGGMPAGGGMGGMDF